MGHKRAFSFKIYLFIFERKIESMSRVKEREGERSFQADSS